VIQSPERAIRGRWKRSAVHRAKHAGGVEAIKVNQAEEEKRDARQERGLRVAPAGFPSGGHFQLDLVDGHGAHTHACRVETLLETCPPRGQPCVGTSADAARTSACATFPHPISAFRTRAEGGDFPGA